MHVQLSRTLNAREPDFKPVQALQAWADKLVVFVISWFCLWPLLITSVCGMAEQWGLPEKVFGFIKVVAE